MGAFESVDSVKDGPRNAEYNEYIMLFGATMAPKPSMAIPRSLAMQRPWSPLPQSYSIPEGSPGPEQCVISESHARDQIHCALCNREFVFFFFGVRNRRWCRNCGRPICQKCINADGKISVRVICKSCSVAGQSSGDESNQLQSDVLDKEIRKEECALCRQPFSFFRPKRRCRQCKLKLCIVCTVVPYARRGSYQEEAMCPHCAYGIDIAARPSGVNLEVSVCQVCAVPFSFFRRRHWCRMCGATICWQCTPSTLFITSRRHPNCICRRCHVPAIFQLSHQLSQYILSFLEFKAQDRCLRVCTRFQQLVDLPFPMISCFTAHYHLDRVTGLLGSGGFGKVYRCLCRNTLQPYAVKIIPKRRIFSMKQWSVTLREIDIQTAIEHPNSIQLFHVMQTIDEVFLIMELATGCDLADFCLRNRRLPESQVAHIVCQLLRFLRHIHSRSVVHRDIKPDNILLSADFSQVKVADFGLAKFIEPPTITSAAELQSLTGTEEPTVIVPSSLAEPRSLWPASLGASPSSMPQSLLQPTRGGPQSLSFTGSPLGWNRQLSEVTSLGPPRQLLGVSPGSSSFGSFMASGGLHSMAASTGLQTPPRTSMRVLCTPCGTLPFCAPEVLAPNAYRKKYPYRRVFKRDMYSLGVVLHLLLVGKLPYSGTTLAVLQEQLQHPVPFEGPQWFGVSRRAKDLCAKLLAANPDERLGAEEALQHDWIAALSHWYSSNELLPAGRPGATVEEPPSPLSDGGTSTNSDGCASFLQSDC